MKGALVFLIVFFGALVVCLGNAWIPPGRTIYGVLNIPETAYPVLGVPATTLTIAVFNGIVYGVVVWVIYSLTLGRRKKA